MDPHRHQKNQHRAKGQVPFRFPAEPLQKRSMKLPSAFIASAADALGAMAAIDARDVQVTSAAAALIAAADIQVFTFRAENAASGAFFGLCLFKHVRAHHP